MNKTVPDQTTPTTVPVRDLTPGQVVADRGTVLRVTDQGGMVEVTYDTGLPLLYPPEHEVTVTPAPGSRRDPDGGRPVSNHPHTELIAGLREMASLLESRPDLAVGICGAELDLAALDSRAELDAWAAALGDADITMCGSSGDIPVVRASVRGLRVRTQSPAEPRRDRLAQAEAEIARLRAELATRTESDR